MRSSQVDWFFPYGSFLVSRPPVTIIRQEHLWNDFLVLTRELNVDSAAVSEPRMAVNATDYSGVPEFTEKGLTNLNTWYSNDVIFYEEVCKFIEERSPHPSQETR